MIWAQSRSIIDSVNQRITLPLLLAPLETGPETPLTRAEPRQEHCCDCWENGVPNHRPCNTTARRCHSPYTPSRGYFPTQDNPAPRWSACRTLGKRTQERSVQPSCSFSPLPPAPLFPLKAYQTVRNQGSYAQRQ